MSQETLNLVISLVLVPVSGALVTIFIGFMNQKVQEIKDKRADAKLNKYIDIANDAIQTAVISTYQTVVSKVKGTEGWTEEIQKAVLEEAKLQAIAIMGTAVKQALEAVNDDFETWLVSKIEAQVCLTKPLQK
jgi:hypothetical protein